MSRRSSAGDDHADEPRPAEREDGAAEAREVAEPSIARLSTPSDAEIEIPDPLETLVLLGGGDLRNALRERAARHRLDLRFCGGIAELEARLEPSRPLLLILGADHPDAVSICRRVREGASGRYVVVLAWGPRVEQGRAEQLVDAGADEVLVGATIEQSLDAHLLLARRRIEGIAERHRRDRRLRHSEELYRRLVETSQDLIWAVDLDGSITFVNRTAARGIYGYEPEELLGRSFLEVTHPDHHERDMETFELVKGGVPHFHYETVHLHRDGHPIHIRINAIVIRDEDGETVGTMGTGTDITAQKQLEEQLAHQAFYDGLTGLPNRILFMDRLGRRLRRGARRVAEPCAVLYLDLDRFKVINDSLGHDAGDELLVQLADRLQEAVRRQDTVARLGGDEFAVLLDLVASPVEAVRVAEEIRQSLTRAAQIGSRELVVDCSLGIAIGESSYERPEQLLRDADIAMYRAKARGGAQWVLFDGEMHGQAVRRLEVENQLRAAIERQELRLHLQPIWHLARGTLEGFEALVRWQHPERGLLGPAEFLSVAEETGLIVPVGDWMLTSACQQLAEWYAEGRVPPQGLTVSVNLSERQIQLPDLADRVCGALEGAGLEPSRLALEVTEGALSNGDDRAALDQLRDLRGLGVQIWIDDFGTGYSSLATLRHHTVDILKIDRSFVVGVATAPDAREIVRAVVAMAHAIGIHVLAEGVETEEQEIELAALGCDLAQGWLLSPALPAKAAIRLLEKGADPIRAIQGGSESPA